MNLSYIDNEQAQGYIASRHHANEGVYIPLSYIDMVNGKMSDAILFSQIMYWHEPNKTGQTKLRVKHEDHYWIAKNHSEWYEETRLKNSTVRNALGRLKELDLIHYKVAGYSGNKTPLIRVNWDTFINLLNNGRGKISSIGHIMADNPLNSGQPNTETTTETTKEKESLSLRDNTGAGASGAVDDDIDFSKYDKCVVCQTHLSHWTKRDDKWQVFACPNCTGWLDTLTRDDELSANVKFTDNGEIIRCVVCQRDDIPCILVVDTRAPFGIHVCTEHYESPLHYWCKSCNGYKLHSSGDSQLACDDCQPKPTMTEVADLTFGTRDNPANVGALCEVVELSEFEDDEIDMHIEKHFSNLSEQEKKLIKERIDWSTPLTEEEIKWAEQLAKEYGLDEATVAPELTCGLCGEPSEGRVCDDCKDIAELSVTGKIPKYKPPPFNPPKPKAKKARKAKKPTNPDHKPMVEAIASAMFTDRSDICKSAWAIIGKAASELVEVGAKPSHMKWLAYYCNKRFEGNYTAMAMAKHYAAFKSSPDGKMAETEPDEPVAVDEPESDEPVIVTDEQRAEAARLRKELMER